MEWGFLLLSLPKNNPISGWLEFISGFYMRHINRWTRKQDAHEKAKLLLPCSLVMMPGEVSTSPCFVIFQNQPVFWALPHF